MTDPPPLFDDPTGVTDRVFRVKARLQRACARAGRDPGEVQLIAASKGQPAERVRAAYEAGLRIFGENRVQEALAKRGLFPQSVEWHLLGPLQSNKVRVALDLFRIFHAVDRVKIARALDREAGQRGLEIEGFLEVNLGEEPSKHGFSPDGLLREARGLAVFSNLRLVGLMAIPPWDEDPERSRPWFRRLRQLRDELAAAPGWSAFPGKLSMGMSHDFEIAVEEGATHVRVGTDIFGPRH